MRMIRNKMGSYRLTGSLMSPALTSSLPATSSALPAQGAPAPTLAGSRLGQRHVVAAVQAPASAPEWAGQLAEIGFIPGEQVVLMARAALGGDPLVVRVGQSTFALRAAEAACIELLPAA
jgi:ferrous iron transport protein A